MSKRGRKAAPSLFEIFLIYFMESLRTFDRVVALYIERRKSQAMKTVSAKTGTTNQLTIEQNQFGNSKMTFKVNVLDTELEEFDKSLPKSEKIINIEEVEKWELVPLTHAIDNDLEFIPL